ncbi:hypothetical protein K505DRAFT_364565 [Melanomma pulvis-pyrius CBS 109.77]|uniref:Uncharacterized protein n=1 Tax=Melanomma pulvis-pyrius CBS 109.77 TaxID=1314802 RepID=A0A6A6X3Z7_9PLEO|nr:hypothetical protein K505DRAFT_364565 [Melanomma pulvis-pyrius CBS 109.77]
MCQLTNLHFACGHTRKVLLEACLLATRLAGHALTRAPDFCLNGVHVVQTIEKEEDCGRGHDGLTCREVQAVQPLIDRYKTMTTDLAGFSARANTIAAFIKIGFTPDCDWDAVKEAGRDVEAFKARQAELLAQVIPEALAEFEASLKNAVQRLQKVFQWNEAHIVCKARGTEDTLAPAPFGLEKLADETVVKSSIDNADDDDDDDDDEQTSKIGNPNLWAVDLAFKTARAGPHRRLLWLEERAVEACLDGAGWQLPRDEKDRAELQDRIDCRWVDPSKK